MKASSRWVALALLGLCLAGCQPSADSVARETKPLLQSKLDSDPDLKPYHLKVSNLDVIHEEGTRYRGIATVGMDGTDYSVALRILDDGHKIMYEIDQGAFAFVARHSLPAKEAWSPPQLAAFTTGCVESVVDSARHGFEAEAVKHGDSGADFPEKELRESLGTLCSCISREIAKRWDYDDFQLNQESHTKEVLEEVTSNGQCPAKGILAQLLGRQAVQAPASTVPARIQQQIDREEELNDQCRGGSGDSPGTATACDQRDKLVSQLEANGWCWGHEPQVEADRRWEPCQTRNASQPP